MPIEQALRVVDSAGAIVFDADGTGVKDRSNRYHSAWQNISWPLLAGSLASYIWTCKEGVWQLQDVEALISVKGGAGATVDVLACGGMTAPGSGVTQLTAVLVVDSTLTAPVRARGTLITTPASLVRGDSIAVNFAGTLTGLVGLLSVQVKRIL